MSVDCKRCDLHKHAKHVFVSSRGSDTPLLLFVAEAPGRQEDSVGTCLIGPAGKKLNEIIKITQIPEVWCRYTNINRCVPWANPSMPKLGVRPPNEEEIAACSPYLEEEILSTLPLYIIPLGLTAIKFFLPGTRTIVSARGIIHTVEIPSLQTRVRKVKAWLKIHPNPALEKAAAKAKTAASLKDIIRKAEKLGFPIIPCFEFSVWPTYHPAAILRRHGDDTFEQYMISDLKYVRKTIIEAGSEQTKPNYVLCTSIEEIKQRCARVKHKFRSGEIRFIVIDTETTCLNSWLSSYPDLLMLSVSTGDETFTISYNHPESVFWDDTLSLSAINGIVNDMLNEVPVIGQNLKFDYHWLYKYGIEIKYIVGDTMLAAWTLFNDNGPKDLETLATRYTSITNHKERLHRAQAGLPKWVVLEQKWVDRLARGASEPAGGPAAETPSQLPMPGLDASDSLTRSQTAPVPPNLKLDNKTKVLYRPSHMGDLPLNLVHEYCCADAHSTYLLHNVFEDMLNQAGLLEQYNNIVAELTLPVVDMEQRGVKIDTQTLLKAENELNAKLAEQRAWFGRYSDEIKQIVEESGEYGKAIKEEVNIASPRSKRVLLFDILGLRPSVMTPTGQPSVDRIYLSEVKAHLEEDEACLDSTDKERLEVVRRILDMNRDAKILSSYVSPIINNVDENNITHPNYGIRTTETGRFTCRGQPLIHGIPRKSVVKSAFIPHDPLGLILISDFSQIELKTLCNYTKDERMLECFKSGRDIHRFVASITLGKPEEEITKEERSRLKAVGFGVIFERGAEAVAAQEHIPVYKAQEAIDKFFEAFPRIQDWIDEQHRMVHREMEVWSKSGFRRVFVQDRFDPRELERRAVNTPVQCDAATIMAMALIQTQKRLKLLRRHGYKSHIWGTVHDSICATIAPNELLTMIKLMKSTMEDWPNKYLDWMSVPVSTSIDVGVSWGDLLGINLLDSNRIEVKGTWERFSKFKRSTLNWSKPPTIESATKEEGTGDDGKPVATAKAILKWE